MHLLQADRSLHTPEATCMEWPGPPPSYSCQEPPREGPPLTGQLR